MVEHHLGLSVEEARDVFAALNWASLHRDFVQETDAPRRAARLLSDALARSHDTTLSRVTVTFAATELELAQE